MCAPANRSRRDVSSKNWQTTQRQRVVDEIEVQLVPVNDILAKHFLEGPYFISIDAEGVDLPILQSIDFVRFRPKMICVEVSADFDPVLNPRLRAGCPTPDNVIYRLVRDCEEVPGLDRRAS